LISDCRQSIQLILRGKNQDVAIPEKSNRFKEFSPFEEASKRIIYRARRGINLHPGTVYVDFHPRVRVGLPHNIKISDLVILALKITRHQPSRNPSLA